MSFEICKLFEITMVDLGNLLDDIDQDDDILDDVELPPIPGTQQAHHSPATNEGATVENPNGQEDEDDPVKEMEYSELVLGENENGEKVIKLDWMDLVVNSQELGRGAFCQVKKATGYYGEDLNNEVVPYAVKVYNRSMLNKEVQCAEVGNLGLCREYDRLKNVELKLWGKVKHPNIVTAFTFYESQ